MNTAFKLLGSAIAVILLASGSARAEGNFYSRVGLGFNATYSEFDAPEEITLSTTGIGLQGELVAGYKLTDALAIHATGFLSTTIDPEFEAEGFELPSDNETFWLLWMAGVGVTYELPGDTYVTNSVGVSQIGIETEVGDDTNVDAYSDAGIVTILGFGKEWAVDDSIALGVAANFYFGFHGIDDDPVDDTAVTVGGGLLGTVSFD